MSTIQVDAIQNTSGQSEVSVTTLKADTIQNTSGASIIKVNTLQDTSGNGYYLARAWVNINGANGSIRGNGNVSSVTDNGSSRFTVNYTNSISSADCSVTASVSNTSYSYLMGVDLYSFGTANCSVRTHDYNSLQDVTYISVTVHV